MADNRLLITDDVKSAFADLLGRKSANISNFKIQGQHISLRSNPTQTVQQNTNSPLQNNDHILTNTHSIPENPQIETNPKPKSASNIPNRGSVLASYIHRFRNAPAINPYKRNQTESNFWWIKNGETHYKPKPQKRPNSAPNNNNTQILMVNNARISDESHSFNDRKPKQTEYKHKHTHSMHSSPTQSIHSSDTKEQEIIHIKSDTNLHSFDDGNEIDVDDILEKWRKKRRLKQLTNENGINSRFQNNNDLFNDSNANNQIELDRIKQRLGILSEHNAQMHTPTQPFTAMIHPIIQTPFAYHSQPMYTEQKTNNDYDCPMTPTKIKPKCTEMKEEELSTNQKRLSPSSKQKSAKKNARTHSQSQSNNFLMDQQLLREQKAKVERLARIQRRMCCNEKKVLTHVKNSKKCSVPNGRQKKICVLSQTKELLFEEKTECEYLSKSIQTMPRVLTPKISKIECENLKKNILNIAETKHLCSVSDPMQVLPKDIITELTELYNNKKIKNETDFDLCFRKILNSHRNNTQIAGKLLQFIGSMKQTPKSESKPKSVSKCNKLLPKPVIPVIISEEKENKCEDTVMEHKECEQSSNDIKQDRIENEDIEKSDSDVIIGWIKQSPNYYLESCSIQNDVELIRNFVDGPIACLKLERLEESETNTDYIEPCKETFSIHDDIEIFSLIKSCKTLRNNISIL